MGNPRRGSVMGYLRFNLALAVVLITLAWVTDSAIDAAILHEGPFFEVLFQAASPVETYMWISGALALLAFAVVVTLLQKRVLESREALRDSQARYRAYHEQAPYAVFVVDSDGRYIDVNESAARLTGYSIQELLTLSIPDLLPEEGMEAGLEIFLELKRSGRYDGDLLMKRKEGETVHASLNAVRLPGDRLMAFCADITRRKELEDELRESRDRLRGFTAHLDQVREEERRRLARELHDEVGQELTAMRMDLRQVKGAPEDERAAFAERLYAMIDLVNDAIDRVNRISHELRSPVLDLLGLREAVQAHAEEVQERVGLEVRLDLDLGDLEQSSDRDTALLRIVQEAMSNVLRHAKAGRVEIGLRVAHGSVVLEVRDDGVGITEEQLDHPHAFGLMGMRERATLVGGIVEITGPPGGGTLVRAVIPV